jgi:hypothetical protein
MKVFGIEISVVVIAIVTGFIGYQFSLRTKRKDNFLKELTVNYTQLYYPMYERLRAIRKIEDANERNGWFNDFFTYYSNSESPIKLLGSTRTLESYFELHGLFKNMMKENTRVEALKFSDNLDSFRNSIEREFWNAHNVIYKDYKKFMDIEFRSPFFALTFEILVLTKQLIQYVLIITGLFLYFTLWNSFISKVPLEEVPVWFDLNFSIVLFVSTIVLYAVLSMYSSLVVWDNRAKKNRLTFKKIIRNLFNRGSR